eukprot:8169766-Pyramimonas_sp.AAC.1
MDPEGVPWLLRTHEDYEEACQKCEKKVTIRTHDETALLSRSMQWLKGDKGRGRTVVVDRVVIGGVKLVSGDRLEPSIGLVDPGQLETV